jgi:hypothetical protein
MSPFGSTATLNHATPPENPKLSAHWRAPGGPASPAEGSAQPASSPDEEDAEEDDGELPSLDDEDERGSVEDEPDEESGSVVVGLAEELLGPVEDVIVEERVELPCSDDSVEESGSVKVEDVVGPVDEVELPDVLVGEEVEVGLVEEVGEEELPDVLAEDESPVELLEEEDGELADMEVEVPVAEDAEVPVDVGRFVSGQSQSPSLLPSSAQTWMPNEPPRQEQEVCAPGMHTLVTVASRPASTGLPASGDSSGLELPAPHPAAMIEMTKKEANLFKRSTFEPKPARDGKYPTGRRCAPSEVRGRRRSHARLMASGARLDHGNVRRPALFDRGPLRL